MMEGWRAPAENQCGGHGGEPAQWHITYMPRPGQRVESILEPYLVCRGGLWAVARRPGTQSASLRRRGKYLYIRQPDLPVPVHAPPLAYSLLLSFNVRIRASLQAQGKGGKLNLHIIADLHSAYTSIWRRPPERAKAFHGPKPCLLPVSLPITV